MKPKLEIKTSKGKYLALENFAVLIPFIAIHLKVG